MDPSAMSAVAAALDAKDATATSSSTPRISSSVCRSEQRSTHSTRMATVSSSMAFFVVWPAPAAAAAACVCCIMRLK